MALSALCGGDRLDRHARESELAVEFFVRRSGWFGTPPFSPDEHILPVESQCTVARKRDLINTIDPARAARFSLVQIALQFQFLFRNVHYRA